MPRDTSPELNFEPEVPSAVPVDGTGDFRVVMNLYADSDFTRIVQVVTSKCARLLLLRRARLKS